MTRATGIALSGVLLLALALRLIGLGYGLPAVYNPDEVAITARTLAFAKGDLNPHNFLYPTFYFYVLFAWLGLSFVASWLTGAVSSLHAFQTQFFIDPTNIYLAGRLLGALCGTATVALTYVLATRLAESSKAGLAAALFLACAPGHVRDSHYVKHDVPVTLAIVVAQLAILRCLRPPSPTLPPSAGGGSKKEGGISGPAPGSGSGAASAAGAEARAGARFLVAGAACGVACSIHYYAVFLALPLVLAIVLAERARGWSAVLMRVIQVGMMTALVFFALSPFLLVEPGTAWRDILANRQIVVDRAVAGRQVLFGNLAVYLGMLWTEGAGWPVCLAAVLGALLLLRERLWIGLVVLAFPVTFLLFISNTVSASRYLNPVFPFCAALAALAVVRLIPGSAVRVALATEGRQGSVSGLPPVRRRVASSGRGQGFPLLVALLMSLPGLILALRLDFFFRQADTRTLAQEAMERAVPAGATVLVQPYSVPLAQSRESLVEALEAHGVDPARASAKFALRLALQPYPSPAYRTLFLGEGGLDQDKIYLGFSDAAGDGLRRAGVQYVVLKRYNAPDPMVEPLRTRLEREGRLLATISPYRAGADAATRARVAPFLHNTDTRTTPPSSGRGRGSRCGRSQFRSQWPEAQ